MLKTIIKVMAKKLCMNCGSEKQNQRSNFCYKCFKELSEGRKKK